ncbi:MAG TPA: response regulator [Verrucomicrobiae bacterium]|nr:response regulator [Verrucomicrobiae bacterium]
MNTPGNTRNNRVLVIDDNPSIHEDIRKILCPSRRNPAMENTEAALFGIPASVSSETMFVVDSALQGEEGLRKIQTAAAGGQPYAMAFVDVRMPPGWDGIETVGRIWKEYPELQVVICTAHSDYAWEDMVKKLGRSDNLLMLKKPFDTVEVLQLAHALTRKWTVTWEITSRLHQLDNLVSQQIMELQAANSHLKREVSARAKLQHSLRLSEERFSQAFNANPVPLAIQSLLTEEYVDVNPGFERVTGHKRDELIGRTPKQLGIWNEPDAESSMLQTLRSEMSARNLQCRFRGKSGQISDILLSVEVVELDGKPYLLIIAQDITEQTKLENQLRQAQKMEAVGQLAAGVAHDFNNILAVVQGNASLLLSSQQPGTAEIKPLESICAAAERAGKLVRQLLTFSRKQLPELHPMNLRDTLAAVSEMLPRVLTPMIEVEVQVPPALPNVCADAGMLESVVMNLAVNARDAMPDGGRIKVSAETIYIGAEAARATPEMREGQFVRLSVADTGCGISPEVLPRIFEPFFTTKPVGKGTGLGLATVYGITRQHHGWVEVESKLNEGTTFHVLLPAIEGAEPVQKAPIPKPRSSEGGGETILVVEDEPDLRDLVSQVLESRGYKVVSAGSGAEALETWAKRVGHIDLLLTDMVMPDGLTGRKLAERLTNEEPGLRVVYTSGYSAGMPGTELANIEESHFLAKPYRPSMLLEVVRRCLDQPAAELVA